MDFFELETIVLLLTLMTVYRMSALGMRHAHLYTWQYTYIHRVSARWWSVNYTVGNVGEGGWLLREREDPKFRNHGSGLWWEFKTFTFS